MESHTVTVTPPLPRRSRPLLTATSTFPMREDCWPEDATSTLVDAWGRLYLKLNRGNLRHKHWEEVADAVNRFHGHVRRRTDIQCKNRIDTLKKKYKIEKAKVSDSTATADDDFHGGEEFKSEWPFFERLDRLLGSNFPVNKPPPPPVVETHPPPGWPFSSVPVGPRSFKRVALYRTVIPKIETPPTVTPVPVGLRSSNRPTKPWIQSRPLDVDDWHSQWRFSALAAAAAAEKDDDDVDKDEYELVSKRPKIEESKADGEGEKESFRDVAMAIEKLGEIYERVEIKKQHYMLEMEKQRLEFLKELEFHRLQLFVETQLKIQQKNKQNVGHKKSVSTSNCFSFPRNRRSSNGVYPDKFP